MAVGMAITITSKDGRVNEQIDAAKKGAALFERLGATTARTLSTTDQLNTVIMVIEAESREALGRLQDRFLAEAEGAAIWEATTKETSPTASSTTMMFFDI
jgi:hypothetical protein